MNRPQSPTVGVHPRIHPPPVQSGGGGGGGGGNGGHPRPRSDPGGDDNRRKNDSDIVDLGNLPSRQQFHLWRSLARNEGKILVSTLESMCYSLYKLEKLAARFHRAFNATMTGHASVADDLAARLFNHQESHIVVEKVSDKKNVRYDVTGEGVGTTPVPDDEPKGKVKNGGSCSSADDPSYAARALAHRLEFPCRYFLGGYCRLGFECLWKHNNGRKHAVTATPAAMCVSKSDNGRICEYFELTGKCRYGDDCRLFHGLADKKKKLDHKGPGSQDHKRWEKKNGPDHRPSDHKGLDKVGKVKESAGKKDASDKKKYRRKENRDLRRAQCAAAEVAPCRDFGASSSSASDQD
jgi:hypothetical protein